MLQRLGVGWQKSGGSMPTNERFTLPRIYNQMREDIERGDVGRRKIPYAVGIRWLFDKREREVMRRYERRYGKKAI